MASLGPQLPSSLAVKRKRDSKEDDQESYSSSPTPSRYPSPDSSAKRPRIIGPALPPAHLDERPPSGPNLDSESSSGDDDFGPCLPTAGESASHVKRDESYSSPNTIGQQTPAQTDRDEWMIVPPSNGDWSARADPTKLKARKFNTGKGAKAPAHGSKGGVDNKWLETPAEKRARLEREMLGIKDTTSRSKEAPNQNTKATAASQKIREYTVSSSYIHRDCTGVNTVTGDVSRQFIVCRASEDQPSRKGG